MEERKQTWWVVCTFNRRELTVDEFLRQRGLTCFIPMQYRERTAGGSEKPRRVLQPVVHNLVFVRADMAGQQMASLLAECTVPAVMMKRKDTDQPVEIADREMLEFRMLCDPAFEGQRSITLAGEEAEVGKEVEIIHGPFSGIRGRLYRKQRKYWFVKTIAGVSIALRITRWYCRTLNNN